MKDQIIVTCDENWVEGLKRMMMDDIMDVVSAAKEDKSELTVDRARDRVVSTFRCYHGEDGFYVNMPSDDDEHGFYGPLLWHEIISVEKKE